MTSSIPSPRGTSFRTTLAAGLAALVVAAAVVPSAEARMGGGSSFGSRGSRSYSAPPSTATAPRQAMPFGNSEAPRYGQSMPGGFGAGMAQPRRFGFGTGLAAGLLGAGVLGMLTGHGFFGGLGGLTSMLGLLLQIGLIVLLVRFAIGFFRNRGSAFAGPAGGGMGRSPLGGLGGGAGTGFGGTRPAGPQGTPLQVTPDDFTAFERQLSEIQYAYGREDITALGRLVTPEMLRNLQSELDATRRRNLRNDLADVRLLQGDLSEAWREGSTDYATVAMRFSCRDTTVDRNTGRVMEGDPSSPVEATELWTFRRDAGRPWCLSGVQQTG
ncbi:TIM44-like domain-containing protein [Lichenihabitans sp. Uapishka_5]|uniref:TIM44-like domain-containing protein n=1 Tax=Lichenihabitans sp. Uapishka_5 TaxID=3037302 RepID=UPI0029E80CF6|nr:TIM44-like domain-containing protein [Lichenihabitans sp. Uapishka_5]MDX7953637.1 TIM44-like domain-containing protein [Lichenihabitans sp. Uapishka_5]